MKTFEVKLKNPHCYNNEQIIFKRLSDYKELKEFIDEYQNSTDIRVLKVRECHFTDIDIDKL